MSFWFSVSRFWLKARITNNEKPETRNSKPETRNRCSKWYFFLPYNGDIRDLTATGVPYTDLRNTLAAIRSRTVLFIDTCHSGDSLGRPGEPSTDTNRMINDLSTAENGVVVFASSTGDQVSYEDAAWENGAFTEALIEGFSGDAALAGRDYITVGMLRVYVSERVKDLTGGKQTPTAAIPSLVPDFHLALRI